MKHGESRKERVVNENMKGKALLSVEEGSDVRAALEAGQKIGELLGRVVSAGGRYRPVLVLPKGDGFEVKGLEDCRMLRPDGIRRTVHLSDAGSLVEYVRTFGKAGTVRMYANPGSFVIKAVLDDHEGNGTPTWCEHEAICDLTPTPKWKFWTGLCGAPLSQQMMAQVIDQRANEIVDPEPARMLELVSELQLTTTAKFGSVVRSNAGQVAISYAEDVKEEPRKGNLTLPRYFTIKVVPFEGTEETTAKVWLCYDVEKATRQLTFRVAIPDAEEIRRTAFDAICARVRAETKLPMFMGTV